MALRIFIGIGFLFLSIAVQAQKSRTELEKERSSIQREIEVIRKSLNETASNRKSSLTQLSLLNRKLRLRQDAVNNMNREIRAINDEMYLSALEIKKLKGELDTLKTQYSESLVYAYKNRSNYDFLNFIFSSANFNDALKRVAYLKSYRSYRDKQADNIIRTQEVLEDKVARLKDTRKDKDNALIVASNEREALSTEKKEQDQVVAKLKSKEKELQSEIDNKRSQDKKIKSAIDAAIRREVELARLEEKKRLEEAKKVAEAKAAAEKAAADMAAAANKANTTVADPVKEKTTTPPTGAVAKAETYKAETDAEALKRAKSVFELTPAGIISSTNFENNKGSLPWPVESGILVHEYGKQTYPGSGLTFQNDGYTIHTPIGASVKVVFDGEVTSVIYLDAGNDSQIVMVKHGKYFTVYGGVTGVEVKKGQTVKVGQTLGKAVTNEEGVGELEFMLLNESRYQNPGSWLKKK